MLELKVLNIQLLSEVGSKLARKFTLKVNANSLNLDRIKWLELTLKSHPGKVPVNFNLIDKDDKYSVNFGSKSIKIKYDQSLMEVLDSTAGIEYSIN